MKATMKTITGICHALVAMFAFVGAEMAQAEWYGFKGSATSPSYWNDKANWYCGGTNELGDVA